MVCTSLHPLYPPLLWTSKSIISKINYVNCKSQLYNYYTIMSYWNQQHCTLCFDCVRLASICSGLLVIIFGHSFGHFCCQFRHPSDSLTTSLCRRATSNTLIPFSAKYTNRPAVLLKLFIKQPRGELMWKCEADYLNPKECIANLKQPVFHKLMKNCWHQLPKCTAIMIGMFTTHALLWTINRPDTPFYTTNHAND